ncbi:MAG TPA: PEP-CTERM sorting domain-containing protein [Verrucomicrobiae bacterium]|jgi:hypothetical protein
MKQQSKWVAVVLIAAGGLMAAGSAQAQSVLNFSTVDTTGLGGWVGATFTAGSPVGSAGTSGLQVVAPSGMYGSTYVNIGNVSLNAGDALAILTFTVNGTASDYNWIGSSLQLNDNSSTQPVYSVYTGFAGGSSVPGAASWSGNTATITFALTGTQLAMVQAGGDALYGFNIGFDSNTGAGALPPNIDITFNSLTLSPVATPEPTTLALAGMGLASLLAFRRRK